MKTPVFLLIMMVASSHLGVSQQASPHQAGLSTEGKWSLSFHGGANLWMNDLNSRRFGPGGDMTLRYGLSSRFSIGMMLGYDRLIALNSPIDPRAVPQRLQSVDYMALKAASANVVVWYHFPPSMEVRPYIYLGVGGVGYLRQNRADKHIPDGKYKVNSSIHVPFGFGFEIPTSQRVSFSVDFGGRIMDDYTDHWKGHPFLDETVSPGVFDWYPTGRIGFNFYMGNKEGDDEDNDGLTYKEERMYGTNPYNADSDGDGLRDGEEIYRHNTDPLKADSDGDGLTDGDEVYKYNTLPNRPDTDGDGLSDGQEILRDETDPLRMDTDIDGLMDGNEILKYGTDPLKSDTDGDNLLDGDELNKYGTDPRNRDTDGGSIDDGTEIKQGTDPLNRRDDVVQQKAELQVEVGSAIVLEGIAFATGSAVISAASEEVLSLALNTLRSYRDMRVEIRGHTDNTGSRSRNDILSQRRADSVKRWLVNRGIEERRIAAVGYGEDHPIHTNLSEDGRQRNRRIEFYRTR